MRSLKTILVCITILAVLAAGFILYQKQERFRNFLRGLFISELKIDDTANVVTEVKNISEFVTVCYYDEIVLTENKKSENLNNRLMGIMGKEGGSQDEFCLIANGKVRAGYDLSKLSENDLIVTGDTLSIRLPEPQVFDIIINPSDFEIYVEDGKWSHEEVVAIESRAKQQIEADAQAYGLLEKADKIGKEKVADLFKTFGYKEVIISE